MPSKSKTGNNPLGSQKINTKNGIETATAQTTDAIGFRTPKQSTSTGMKQVNNAAIHAPKRLAQIKNRIPHAWWAYLFVEDGAFKATFTEGFIVENREGALTEVFEDDEDRTREVAIDDVFYIKVTYDSEDITGTEFNKFVDPENTDTDRYIKIVEFLEGSVEGTLAPKYYRFDSIEWVYPTMPTLDYTIYFLDEVVVVITEAQATEGYLFGNLSLEFALSGTGEFTGGYVVSSEIDRFPEVDDVQTAYRLPVYKSDDPLASVRVSSGGIYQEVRMCASGSAVTQLIKVG